MEYFHNTRVIGFNPHTHAGCDIARCHFFIFKKVSIHTPTQGVTDKRIVGVGSFIVSIHTPTQGVTPIQMQRMLVLAVSIHTPTQGVTRKYVFAIVTTFVSIHTPTQGVTLAVSGIAKNGTRFNPHTHAGCDSYLRQTLWNLPFVSIHTPTQGVTLYLITYYKSANLIHCYANHHYYSTS